MLFMLSQNCSPICKNGTYDGNERHNTPAGDG